MLKYILPQLGNQRELEGCLFEDLHIDEDGLAGLNTSDITTLAGLYGSTNVKLLDARLQRGIYVNG